VSAGATEQAPRAERESRRADVKRILGRFLVGACQSVIAAGLGVSRQYLGRLADAEVDSHLSVADAAGLPDAARMELAQYIAGPGHMVAEAPAVDSDVRAGMSLHLRALRETTEAVTSHAMAMADGRITRSEGASLEGECDEAIRVLLAVREVARRAQRDGVIGVDLH
jgi:hypothetical protein